MTDDRHANAEAFVGRNLLDAMIDELKTTDEAWSKLSKQKQDDTIDRIRARIQSSVRMALEGMLTSNMPAVAATLGKVTFNAKGISCDLSLDRHMKSRHELADHAGQTVVIVLADPEEYFAGMDDVVGEPDQRWLFDAAPPPAGDAPPPAEPEPETDEGPRPDFAAVASLIPRFAEHGISLPEGGEDFPGTGSQVRDLAVYADALDGDLKPQLPKWLEPFVDEGAQYEADAGDTELVELVIALHENGLGEATVKRCAPWSAEERQDVWDWIEVVEAGGELPDHGSNEGFDAGEVLITPLRELAEREQAQRDAEAEAEAAAAEAPTFNPAELNERLRGVGIAVPGTVVSSWGDGEVEAVQRYIDEFNNESGPAELPEFLEPYVQAGLAPQNGAESAFDEWAILRAEPAKLAERLRAHNINVPDHEAYAWTSDARRSVTDYLAAVLEAAEQGKALPEDLAQPVVLAPYLGGGPAAAEDSGEAQNEADPDAQAKGNGTKKKTSKKKTSKKKASKKKPAGKGEGAENGASTEPPPQE